MVFLCTIVKHDGSFCLEGWLFRTWTLQMFCKNICLRVSVDVKREMMESVSGSKAAADQEEPGLVISGHMVQAVFSMIWSTVVMELWKRRSSSLSYRWGTMDLAERFAEPRPGFHGELGVNPVTRRVEPLFSEWQRNLRMALVSVPVVGLFLGEAD